MTESRVCVLSLGRQLDAARSDRPDELWLSTRELAEVSGWELKPEGLCQGETCVPLSGTATRSADGERVCVSDLWTGLGRPLLHDAAGKTWFLGEAAEDRERLIQSLEAPDFALPDLDGKLHHLSDYRGKKILLATWASW